MKTELTPEEKERRRLEYNARKREKYKSLPPEEKKRRRAAKNARERERYHSLQKDDFNKRRYQRLKARLASDPELRKKYRSYQQKYNKTEKRREYKRKLDRRRYETKKRAMECMSPEEKENLRIAWKTHQRAWYNSQSEEKRRMIYLRRKERYDSDPEYRARRMESIKRHRKSEKCRQTKRAYRQKIKEYIQLTAMMWRIRQDEIFCSDCTAYATYREKERVRSARYRRKKNPGMRPYRPKPSMRIPDYMVKGECNFNRGQFIFTTRSGHSFARDLAREQWEKMEPR